MEDKEDRDKDKEEDKAKRGELWKARNKKRKQTRRLLSPLSKD